MTPESAIIGERPASRKLFLWHADENPITISKVIWTTRSVRCLSTKPQSALKE